MNETITVDEALARGQRMLMYPCIFILFGTMGLTLYLGLRNTIPTWGIPCGFLLSFVFCWLYYSFKITKWRIWAFENVRNVHELKKRAIQEKLIGADESIFEKFEIRTSRDKIKLGLLQDKFQQDDLFEDDLTIPFETVIYNSRVSNGIVMIVMLFGLGGGIYLVAIIEKYIIGTILSVISAYISFSKYRDVKNAHPQIILNEKGIETSSTEFYRWNEIQNEEVISDGYGNHSHCYLIYNHPNGVERFQIDFLGTNSRNLNKLLRLYRGRSNKTTNR